MQQLGRKQAAVVVRVAPARREAMGPPLQVVCRTAEAFRAQQEQIQLVVRVLVSAGLEQPIRLEMSERRTQLVTRREQTRREERARQAQPAAGDNVPPLTLTARQIPTGYKIQTMPHGADPILRRAQ